MWTFSGSVGIWLSEALSQSVLARAERQAGQKVALIKPVDCGLPDLKQSVAAYKLKLTTCQVRAYGRAMAIRDVGFEWPDDRVADDARCISALVESLAGVLPAVVAWIALPQLRRGDGDKWTCSCGLTFPNATDYSRRDFGRAKHNAKNPQHVIVRTQQPGAVVAWYGVGMGAPLPEPLTKATEAGWMATRRANKRRKPRDGRWGRCAV